MSIPKISVVMPVYNAEKYLRESIDSILNQTFKDFEFIIINDGSTDSSLEIIKYYNDSRIHIVDQDNTGLAKALNNGIALSTTEFIARMDADDIAMPERLGKQYHFLSNNPKYIIVGSNAENIDVDGNYVYTTSQKITDNNLRGMLPCTPFIHPSVMFRKDIYYKAGKYPEYMLKAQDTVLFNRMAKFGKIANLPESLMKYRIVPTSNSLRSREGRKRIHAITSKAILKNEISSDDYEFLKTLTSNRNSKERLANYHLHLAKKYLWNNYNSRLARENIFKSFKIKKRINTVGFLLISLLPKNLIVYLYKKFRNKK